jgi:hypothetical protein
MGDGGPCRNEMRTCPWHIMVLTAVIIAMPDVSFSSRHKGCTYLSRSSDALNSATRSLWLLSAFFFARSRRCASHNIERRTRVFSTTTLTLSS